MPCSDYAAAAPSPGAAVRPPPPSGALLPAPVSPSVVSVRQPSLLAPAGLPRPRSSGPGSRWVCRRHSPLPPPPCACASPLAPLCPRHPTLPWRPSARAPVASAAQVSIRPRRAPRTQPCRRLLPARLRLLIAGGEACGCTHAAAAPVSAANDPPPPRTRAPMVMLSMPLLPVPRPACLHPCLCGLCACASAAGRDFKEGSLRFRDFKEGSLRFRDFKEGSLRFRDFKEGSLEISRRGASDSEISRRGAFACQPLLLPPSPHTCTRAAYHMPHLCRMPLLVCACCLGRVSHCWR